MVASRIEYRDVARHVSAHRDRIWSDRAVSSVPGCFNLADSHWSGMISQPLHPKTLRKFHVRYR